MAGAVESTSVDQVAELQPGASLLRGQYRIEHFLGSGGFGMTYLASDSLKRRVVIKECFPQAMCRRDGDRVLSRSSREVKQFRGIVRHFIREAHRLAKLDHPNIVGVHQVFEDNDTAYMALDFIDGPDMFDSLENKDRRLPPEQIKQLLVTLLDAIGYTHNNGLLHCDISPDNILMASDGHPVLIDFGAAREARTGSNRVLSSLRVVKDGYSPQELYLSGSEQGPYSDLYALGATFYHLIAGRRPPKSQARLASIATDKVDPYKPLGRLKASRGFEKDFILAIDRALSVLPADRFQSAEEWIFAIDREKRKAAAIAKAQSDEGMVSAIRRMVEETQVEDEEDGSEADAPAAAGGSPDIHATPDNRSSEQTGTLLRRCVALLFGKSRDAREEVGS